MKMFFVGIVGGFRDFQKPAMCVEENPLMLGLFLRFRDKPVDLDSRFGQSSKPNQQISVMLTHGEMAWFPVEIPFHGIGGLFVLP